MCRPLKTIRSLRDFLFSEIVMSGRTAKLCMAGHEMSPQYLVCSFLVTRIPFSTYLS